jgi:hypothetical protein
MKSTATSGAGGKCFGQSSPLQGIVFSMSAMPPRKQPFAARQRNDALGHLLPRHLTERAAALPHKAAAV